MKIVVTSCSKIQQISPQPVWKEIKEESPDVLILLGDNIYLDHDKHKSADKLRTELQGLYSDQLNDRYFSELLDDIRSRGAKLLAIYDDHDFIGNNRYGGDNDPSLRDVAREELIHAFAIPITGDDVYSLTQTELVDIVVLDERFYRQKPSNSRGDRDAVLGAKQWEWFEDVVTSSDAPYLVVASSSTYHDFIGESWEQYPGAFDRMRRLLSEKDGTLIISGDVHRNELYDDSGVMEIVTSAVARKSVVFGKKRKNYGVFTFSDNSMRVDLRSLKSGWRFDLTIPLDNWEL